MKLKLNIFSPFFPYTTLSENVSFRNSTRNPRFFDFVLCYKVLQNTENIVTYFKLKRTKWNYKKELERLNLL